MPGRLNLFQATMLRWRGLHPYTAVHVLRVPAPLEPARLEAALRRVLEQLGLTGFTLSGGRFRFAGGASAAQIAVLPGGADPRRALDAAIASAINTPFPADGRFDPFRFFAVDAREGFFLGLAYDHFVAAADSIVVLLAEIIEAYVHGGPVPRVAAAAPLEVHPATYRRLFLRHAARFVLGLARLPALGASCRRAFRPPTARGGGRESGYASFRIDPPGFRALRQAAAAWGVTLNDLFMAVLLVALAPLAGARREEARRTEIGVATIVNIRGEYQPDARHTFGQFLGAMRVAHPVPPEATLEAVARDVHAQTARAKRGKLYLQGLLALGAVGLAWPYLTEARRDRFFPKHYPVWAGVTAINVNSLWPGAAERFPSLEYLRAVSTGPLAPLVLSITTLGEVLQVGLTYRSAVIPRSAVDGLAAEFVRRISMLPTCIAGPHS